MFDYIRALVNASDVLLAWTTREIKVRYADTSLGVAWILVYPACWVVLFTFLFSHLMPVPVNGAPYPLFVMSGLVPWFFFSAATNNAVSSLRHNAGLIPKVYFPREILPLGSVLVGLVDLFLYILMMGAMMLVYRKGIGMQALALVPVILALAALTLAVALFTARMALFRRDVQLLVPLALQFFMYCQPVFYPSEIVPLKYRTVYLLNPLAALMDAFRRILVYGQWPQWTSFLLSVAVSFVLLALAYLDFKRAEPEFADRL